MEKYLTPEETALIKHVTSKLSEAKYSEINSSICEYRGYNILGPFCREAMEYVNEEWEIPENSVFISSYPKTGTVWCNNVVSRILYNEKPELLDLFQHLPKYLAIGNRQTFEMLKKLPFTRHIFRTHLAEEMLDFEKIKKSNSKMIYMIRNPKDQAVSWYHFSRKIPINDSLKNQLGKDWNEFFANYVEGKHPCFSKPGQFYPDLLLGWMKHKNEKNFLVVVFEEMKKDFPKEIRRIAEFLEVELDDTKINEIADACSIKALQEAAAKEPTGLLKINVRKGEVGGWKDQFTVAQSELMDKIIEEKLAGTGIEFTYTL